MTLMKSKGFLRFYNRVQYFQADVELIDIILKNKEKIAGENSIFSEISPQKHSTIASYANTAHSRELAICHLRTTLFVSYIKEMYEEVTEYLRYVLVHSARNGANINRLVGPHKVNLDANFLLSANSYDVIARAVTDSIFQQLENERSSLELIKKINTKLDLQLSDDIINDALPYLLIRHIFIHSDGKPTDEFSAEYPFIKTDVKKRIKLSESILKKAKTNILKLIKEIDTKILAKGFIPANEIQP